jgi:hypothetical protein
MMIFEERDANGRLTDRWVGRMDDGTMTTSGVGQELCCAMAREIERLRENEAELVDACRLARCELYWLIEQTKSRKGGCVDKAYQACLAVLKKYPSKKQPKV